MTRLIEDIIKKIPHTEYNILETVFNMGLPMDKSTPVSALNINKSTIIAVYKKTDIPKNFFL